MRSWQKIPGRDSCVPLGMEKKGRLQKALCSRAWDAPEGTEPGRAGIKGKLQGAFRGRSALWLCWDCLLKMGS